jgi:multicomponent Na+:H+ antiporter subunit B
MRPLILRTAANYLLPLLLLFAIFILLRGHYKPGGGFLGGLIAAIAFVLHALANGYATTLKLLKVHPAVLVPIGLLVSFLSGLLPLLTGDPYLTGLWLDHPLPVLGLIGTALFFDIGVFLVVFGITLTILFTIAESV